MSNRQVQRDAQRERRREERARARRDVRQSRAPAPAPGTSVELPPKRSLPWAWIIVGVIAVALIVPGGYWLIKANNAPLPGQTFASLGNMHITPGDSHPVYNSNPPTSGWHFPTWPQRGVYTSPLPEEYLLHFQEHAGVVVHYNPDRLPKDQQDQLTAIVKSELDKGQGLVVLAPDPSIPDLVAVSAWQHLVTFSTVSGNKSKIEDAIERLQCNYDPEGVCGPPHGVSFQPTGTPAPGVATVTSGPIPNGAPQGTAAPGQKSEPPTSGTPTP
jgi:hypothetical protein